MHESHMNFKFLRDVRRISEGAGYRYGFEDDKKESGIRKYNSGSSLYFLHSYGFGNIVNMARFAWSEYVISTFQFWKYIFVTIPDNWTPPLLDFTQTPVLVSRQKIRCKQFAGIDKAMISEGI